MVSKLCCVINNLRTSGLFYFLENSKGRHGDSMYLDKVLLNNRGNGRSDEDYAAGGWVITDLAYGPILEWPVEAVGEPPEGL